MAFYESCWQFLNNRHSTLYSVLFLCIFFFTTGFLWAILSGSIAILVSSLYFALFNRKRHIPKGFAVILTGCSKSSIGFTTALDLAKQGLVVFATVGSLEDANTLIKANALISPVVLDVDESDATLKTSVAIIESSLKANNLSLLAIVNATHDHRYGFLECVGPDDLRRSFELNVLRPVSFTNSFLPLLRNYAPKAPHFLTPKVIFLSSAVSRTNVAGAGLVTSNQASVDMLAKTYRQELKQQGIHVVLIAPGHIAGTIGGGETYYRDSKGEISASLQFKHRQRTLVADGRIIDQSQHVTDYYEYAESREDFEFQRRLEGTMARKPNQPLEVASVIFNVISTPKPHSLYHVGSFTILSAIILHWLPTNLADLFGWNLFKKLSSQQQQQQQQQLPSRGPLSSLTPLSSSPGLSYNTAIQASTSPIPNDRDDDSPSVSPLIRDKKTNKTVHHKKGD